MIIDKKGDLYIIKLFNYNNINIFDLDDISNLFKNVLIKLKNKYDLSGFCKVEVFANEIYGVIIEVNNVEKYDNDIDIKIRFYIDSIFMHEIYFEEREKYSECYLFNNKYYAKYKGICDSEIIYRDAFKIIENGIKVK